MIKLEDLAATIWQPSGGDLDRCTLQFAHEDTSCHSAAVEATRSAPLIAGPICGASMEPKGGRPPCPAPSERPLDLPTRAMPRWRGSRPRCGRVMLANCTAARSPCATSASCAPLRTSRFKIVAFETRPATGCRASAEIPVGAQPPQRRLRKAPPVRRRRTSTSRPREVEPNEDYDTWITNRAFCFKLTAVALARTLIA